MKVAKLSCVLLLFFAINAYSLERNLIINVDNRSTVSLNGKWRAIIDPYENGYYDYRYLPKKNGYFKNAKARNKTDLIEYDFDKSETLNVPGDWNSQQDKHFFYEGTVWYKRSFDYQRKPPPRQARFAESRRAEGPASPMAIKPQAILPTARMPFAQTRFPVSGLLP